MTLWDHLLTEALAWPGVETRKSRFSGARGLWVDGREIAHEHDATRVDVRLPKTKRAPYAALCPTGDPKKRAAWIELEAHDAKARALVLEALEAAHAAARR